MIPEAAAPSPTDAARQAARKVLFVTIFLDLLGFGIVVPLFPYYAKECGADGTIVGLVGSSYSLLQFLMAPFWGRLSDRVGRRPVILTGLVGSAVSYFVFGAAFRLSALLGIGPIPILFASRAMAGFFNANLSAAQAYMADITPLADRATAMGLVGAAFGLGFTVGPAFSAVLWWVTGSSAMPFYGAGLCGLATFVWAWRVLPESRSLAAPDAAAPAAPRRRWESLQAMSLPLALTMVLYFTSTFAMSGMENTLGLFVESSPDLRYKEWQFALLVLFLGLMMVLVQGIGVKWLSRRFREEQLLVAGCTIMIFALGLTPVARSTAVLYLLMGALCTGYGLVSPSLSSLASLLSPESIRGEVLGVGQSMGSLGRIIGPAVGGWLYEHAGHGGPYYMGGVASLVASVIALMLLRRARSGEPGVAAIAGAAASAPGAAGAAGGRSAGQ